MLGQLARALVRLCRGLGAEGRSNSGEAASSSRSGAAEPHSWEADGQTDPLAPIDHQTASTLQHLHSVESRVSLHVHFINTLDEPVRLLWISYEVRMPHMQLGRAHARRRGAAVHRRQTRAHRAARAPPCLRANRGGLRDLRRVMKCAIRASSRARHTGSQPSAARQASKGAHGMLSHFSALPRRQQSFSTHPWTFVTMGSPRIRLCVGGQPVRTALLAPLSLQHLQRNARRLARPRDRSGLLSGASSGEWRTRRSREG